MLWAKLILGLVQLLNFFTEKKKEDEIEQRGEDLMKGKQDAKTLSNVEKAQAARARDNSSLDDELCIKD